MKDLVFSGADVTDAVQAAALALDAPTDTIRYIVLDTGAPAQGRQAARPARIAVLVDAQDEPQREASRADQEPAHQEPADLEGRLSTLANALGRAADVGTRVALTEDAETLTIQVSTEEPAFLWGKQGEVFEALEHVIRKVAVRHAQGRRIVIRDDAHRERRDAALREHAREAAAGVRGDGLTRELRNLNSYERRVIHLALEGEAGVRTRSVGSGDERTLLVEPAERDAADGA
jgi:spoIIIJ-associated protein